MDAALHNTTPDPTDSPLPALLAPPGLSQDPDPAAPVACQCTETLLMKIESMLSESYALGESAEDWWARFAGYYRSLQLDARTRNVLNSKLDWLFCRQGETGWPTVRLGMFPAQEDNRAVLAREGADEEQEAS